MVLPWVLFMTKPTPTYDLGEIKRLIKEGRLVITRAAVNGAAALYLDTHEIIDCVLALSKTELRKSMPSVSRPRLSQDVYKTRHCGFAIYLKLQIARGTAVVIQFKQDQSP